MISQYILANHLWNIYGLGSFQSKPIWMFILHKTNSQRYIYIHEHGPLLEGRYHWSITWLNHTWSMACQCHRHQHQTSCIHDAIMAWKLFLHYWTFRMGTYRLLVVSFTKGLVMLGFGVLFHVDLPKLLNKQLNHWWIEMPGAFQKHCE